MGPFQMLPPNFLPGSVGGSCIIDRDAIDVMVYTTLPG